jgi:hypothetical protein
VPERGVAKCIEADSASSQFHYLHDGSEMAQQSTSKPESSVDSSHSTYGADMENEHTEPKGWLVVASKGLLWFVVMTSIACFSLLLKGEIFLAIGTLAVLGAISEIMITIRLSAASPDAPRWLKSLDELQGTFAQK